MNTYNTVQDALTAYDDTLDECHPDQIMNIQASRILREIDPTAYRCGFHDWLDAGGIDSDELDGWDRVDL